MTKKYFNKELVIAKEGNEYSKNSNKCWICDDDYIDNDVKVRDHSHITGKYRGSAHRGCNINVILQPKKYDSQLIIQELCKFNLKVNVISNGLEKYMSSSINNKLNLIDSFQFLSSS